MTPKRRSVIRCSVTGLLLAAAVVIAASSGKSAAKEERSEIRVRAGVKAPDFTLAAADGKQIKLSDFAGQWVLLDFYRAYW